MQQHRTAKPPAPESQKRLSGLCNATLLLQACPLPSRLVPSSGLKDESPDLSRIPQHKWSCPLVVPLQEFLLGYREVTCPSSFLHCGCSPLSQVALGKVRPPIMEKRNASHMLYRLLCYRMFSKHWRFLLKLFRKGRCSNSASSEEK